MLGKCLAGWFQNDLLTALHLLSEDLLDSQVGEKVVEHYFPSPINSKITLLKPSCGSAGKESACNARDLGLIPGLGRSPGEGKGYPLQYSALENPKDYTVHGVTKSQIQLSDFHFPGVSSNLTLLKNKKYRSCFSHNIKVWDVLS